MTSFLGKKRTNQVAFTPPGTTIEKKIGSSFYRGETLNISPHGDDFGKEGFLQDYVLQGWLPPAPVLSRGTKITAFGSCFALHITKHLTKIGFDLSRDRDPDIYISSIGEGLVNSHALLGQFEWALLDKKPPENLWHGFKAEDYGYDEDIRQRTRKVFLETEFFIITLGLSEVWYDEVTGGVFWRAVPLEKFDASRHKFRVSTMAETKANLEYIYALIREHVPRAKVLFTLSPVPLAATFRPVSMQKPPRTPLSKAILRAALDEMIREHGDDQNTRLFYFPSYEISQELFPQRFQNDGRHLATDIVHTIMSIFESTYCDGGLTAQDATTLYRKTRAKNIASLDPESAGEASGEAGQSESQGQHRTPQEGSRRNNKAKRHEGGEGRTHSQARGRGHPRLR